MTGDPTPLIRRPLSGAILALAAGIITGIILKPGLLLAALLLCAAFLFAILNRNRLRTPFHIFFLLGIYAAASALTTRTALTQIPRRIFSPVELRLLEEPEFKERNGKKVTACKALIIRHRQTKRRVPVELIIESDQTPKLAGGRHWRAGGRFYPFRNPGALTGRFYAEAETLSRLPDTTADLLAQRTLELRQHWARQLTRGLDPGSAQAAVLQALLPGIRSRIPDRQHEAFKKTGTLHIFALSGLHIGMLALVLVSILRCLCVPRRFWGACALPLLFFYVFCTGMRASALRAFLMAAAYWSAPLIRRKPDPAGAICLAALVLLIAEPLQILTAGFQLSFITAGGIMLFFSAWPLNIPATENAQHFANRLRIFCSGLWRTSLAAWLFSCPLILYWFGGTSLYSLPANLTVVPLTFSVVLSTVLSTLSAPLPALISESFNHAAAGLTTLIFRITGFFAALPGAWHEMPKPDPLLILLWYAGAVLLCTAQQHRNRRLALLLTGTAAALYLTLC